MTINQLKYYNTMGVLSARTSADCEENIWIYNTYVNIVDVFEPSSFVHDIFDCNTGGRKKATQFRDAAGTIANSGDES